MTFCEGFVGYSAHASFPDLQRLSHNTVYQYHYKWINLIFDKLYNLSPKFSRDMNRNPINYLSVQRSCIVFFKSENIHVILYALQQQ